MLSLINISLYINCSNSNSIWLRNDYINRNYGNLINFFVWFLLKIFLLSIKFVHWFKSKKKVRCVKKKSKIICVYKYILYYLLKDRLMCYL